MSLNKYDEHSLFMKKHGASLIEAYFISVLFFIILTAFTKLIRDSISHCRNIKDFKSGDQWLHISYFNSIFHAFLVIGFCIKSLFECHPPNYKSGTVIGNTMLMNDYCVDHGNWWQCFSTVFFGAYLTVDFILCYFFICDQSPGAA